VEAVWQLCQAERWQEAYALMEREGIFATLKRSGGNAILLELYLLLFPLDKWHPDRSQEARIYNELGAVYRLLGRMEQARMFLDQALRIYTEDGDHLGQGRVLNDLGRVFADLGNEKKAKTNYDKRCTLNRRMKYPSGE